MFTGLIEETGCITRIETTPTGIRLVVLAKVCAEGTRPGDSIAVDGACLTAVKCQRARGGTSLHFDLLQETWRRTRLQSAKVGDSVNLERALAAGARLGGHFVTGHVDDIGRITRWEPSGKDRVLEITVPAGLRSSFVPKGSVAVDGISLTVADVLPGGFRAWIIPHTYSATALRERQVGDAVNLETDLLGKYVTRFLDLRGPPPARRKPGTRRR